MSNTETGAVNRLGTDELTSVLNQNGYQTIFDIASESFPKFSERNSGIPESEARQIYKTAEERVGNLEMLCKAWQLHHDPIIQGIPKLSANTGLKSLESALERSLGDGADFGDLFPDRSPEGYAEASSIQSLFSPGRYLTALYKIARQLHSTSNELHIDKRRPDLQSLLLTTDNMNKKVTSLDILLGVLQPNGTDTLESLKDTYYPMNLPYDDDLIKIRVSAADKGTDLIHIWDILNDTQRSIFSLESISDTRTIGMSPRASLYSKKFYLHTNGKPCYFANFEQTFSKAGEVKAAGAYFTIGKPQDKNAIQVPLQIRYYDREPFIQYRLFCDDKLSPEQVGSYVFFYLFSGNGQEFITGESLNDHPGRGDYCMMYNCKRQAGADLPVKGIKRYNKLQYGLKK